MTQIKIENTVNQTTSNLSVSSCVEKRIGGTTYKVITRFNGDASKDLKSAMLRLACRDLDTPALPTEPDNVGV